MANMNHTWEIESRASSYELLRAVAIVKLDGDNDLILFPDESFAVRPKRAVLTCTVASLKAAFRVGNANRVSMHNANYALSYKGMVCCPRGVTIPRFNLHTAGGAQLLIDDVGRPEVKVQMACAVKYLSDLTEHAIVYPCGTRDAAIYVQALGSFAVKHGRMV